MVEISSQQFAKIPSGTNSTRQTPSSSNTTVNSKENPGTYQSVASDKEKSATGSADASQQASTPAAKREERQNEQAIASEILKLQSRDREVRAHEAAHVAAGGKHITSGASFSYERGPNGRLYAVGGEVSIDTSAVPSNPQATLEKAEVVRRAALAPAQPSAQDQRVASTANNMASRARVEIAVQQREQLQQQAEARKSQAAGEAPPVESDSSSGSSAAAGYSSASLESPADDVFNIIA